MKRIFLLGLILFGAISILPSGVSAHILETNGNIGAVLHIDPDDDPIAGQQAGFFFEFKDKQNKFDPKLCDCTFIISEQGKQIFSQDLFASNSTPSLDNASVFYTFPKRDVYQVQVAGKPLAPNGFQPFTLTYNIRVDQGTNIATGSTSISNLGDFFLTDLLVGIVGLLVTGGLIIYFFKRRTRHRKRKPDEEENRKLSNAY